MHKDADFIDDFGTMVRDKYRIITLRLIEKGRTITTMESCTGGQIASLITDTEGSSTIFRGAWVTYHNDAKVKAGVPADVIGTYGVYSDEMAAAMARTCRRNMDADIGVGVTGSFGNVDPENSDSVPGEVFFAISTANETRSFHCTIPVQKTRPDYKLYMADVVADRIREALGR